MSDFERTIGLEGPLGPPRVRGSRLDRWWQRLMSSEPRRRVYQWGVPAVLALVASMTRLIGLGHPRELVFDETFYVKDAWSLWNLGFSANWPEDANTGFTKGIVDTYLQTGSYVVHPPLGKWLIGLGMYLGGAENSLSWRLGTAVAGIVAVLLLFYIAKRLFGGSTLLGGIAGFLFAIDGNAIVMSRVALLDNFVMVFGLLGFGAILLDRAWTARKLEAWVEQRHGEDLLWPPVFWARPWLFAAGIAFGLTASVKWSGLYFLAGFAVYTLVVDALARRRAGIVYWPMTFPLQGVASFLLTVPVAGAVYLASWASWFTTSGGYGRHWAEAAGNAATGALSWVPLSVQSFWHYQQSVYAYHVGEMRPHAYQANPLTWLFMVRPTSMYYQDAKLGELGCTVAHCGSSIVGIANPLIWWAATAALAYLAYRLLRLRDWRAGLILTGMAVAYLPWLLYLNRTVFQFYTIAFEPYLILGLTMAIGAILGSRHDPPGLRTRGLVIVGGFLIVATALSVFFWPLWTGMQLDFEWLAAHWWLPTWR